MIANTANTVPSNEALLASAASLSYLIAYATATVAGGVASIIRIPLEASGLIGKNALTAKITPTNTAGTKINLTML